MCVIESQPNCENATGRCEIPQAVSMKEHILSRSRSNLDLNVLEVLRSAVGWMWPEKLDLVKIELPYRVEI